MSLAFLLTSLVVCATPGTGVVYTLSAALSRGHRAALIAAAGCALGTVPHAVATVTGLAALLHTSPVAFRTVQYLGVGYLLYLAWATWRDRSTLAVVADSERRPASRVIGGAVLVNLLNPKLTVFFVAFLPQFVDPAAPHPAVRMIELSAVFTLITFTVFAGYGAAAAGLRRYVVTRPAVTRAVRRVNACAFGALAAGLAVGGR